MPRQTSPFICVGIRRKGPSSWEKAPAGKYGLQLGSFEPDTGRIALSKTLAEDISAGAAFHHQEAGVVYALDEALTLPGRHLGGGGQVCAFKVDPDTGELSEINRQPSFGTLPCYAAWDSAGEFLLVVNHTGHTPVTRTEQDADGQYRIVLDYDEAGTVLYPLRADGGIEPPCDIFRHHGHGALPAQTHPQLHSVVRAPHDDLFVVCDKGADRIHFFSIDRDARKLRHHAGMTIAAPAGSSPRYSAFHPLLPVFYVNFETAPLIHVYRYDAASKTVSCIQTVNTIPDDRPAEPSMMQSDMIMHPDGRHLYGLMRGVENASVFEIDQKTGRLNRIQVAPLDVRNARGATISPDGRHFLVAAMVSNEIKAWRIGDDGRLSSDGVSNAVTNPGCVLFL